MMFSKTVLVLAPSRPSVTLFWLSGRRSRRNLKSEEVSACTAEIGQGTDERRQELAQELQNGREIRPSKKVGAGFRLAAKDGSGYFDCSDEEIAQMLMPFFRDMRL